MYVCIYVYIIDKMFCNWLFYFESPNMYHVVAHVLGDFRRAQVRVLQEGVSFIFGDWIIYIYIYSVIGLYIYIYIYSVIG